MAVEANVFSGAAPGFRACAAASQGRCHQTIASVFSRGGSFVTKSELIEHIARQADISKAAATRALEAAIGGVKTTLKKGGSVSIVGVGNFAVTKRAARVGRNPRTNE